MIVTTSVVLSSGAPPPPAASALRLSAVPTTYEPSINSYLNPLTLVISLRASSTVTLLSETVTLPFTSGLATTFTPPCMARAFSTSWISLATKSSETSFSAGALTAFSRTAGAALATRTGLGAAV
jgi:hypothetical protein